MIVEMAVVEGKKVITIDGSIPSIECLFNTLKALAEFYEEHKDETIRNER